MNFTDDSEQLNSDEEYDDLDSGQEASISDDADSFTKDSDSDLETSNQNVGDDNGEKNVVYGNFGWADAMSKVLKSSKPKTKKSVILSKAKKDADILKTMTAKAESSLGFEIEGVKKEDEHQDPDVARRNAHIEKMLRRRRRKEWDLVGRVQPSVTEDRERERVLAKIATR